MHGAKSRDVLATSADLQKGRLKGNKRVALFPLMGVEIGSVVSHDPDEWAAEAKRDYETRLTHCICHDPSRVPEQQRTRYPGFGTP